MREVLTSSRQFLAGSYGAIVAAVAAISDPLHWFKALGLVSEDVNWLFEPWVRQLACALFAFGWMFIWFHRARMKFEDSKPPRPNLDPTIMGFVTGQLLIGDQLKNATVFLLEITNIGDCAGTISPNSWSAWIVDGKDEDRLRVSYVSVDMNMGNKVLKPDDAIVSIMTSSVPVGDLRSGHLFCDLTDAQFAKAQANGTTFMVEYNDAFGRLHQARYTRAGGGTPTMDDIHIAFVSGR